MLQTQLAADIHAVDERPAAGRLLVLGLQHVLVMYAGNVAVPLLVAQSLKLSVDQTAFLINADLFAAGIATLIQTLGVWRFGARLPVMMGATFLSVSPMIAMGLDPAIGLRAFYGALLVSGCVAIIIAPMIGTVLALFPPVVTGSLITLLGISLLAVAVSWAAAGQTSPRPAGLGISFLVFVVIVLMTKYAPRRLAQPGDFVWNIRGNARLHSIRPGSYWIARSGCMALRDSATAIRIADLSGGCHHLDDHRDAGYAGRIHHGFFGAG